MEKEVLLKNQRGATAVEFAIVLPLFITLIFGVVEFGLYLFNKQVIINASREGARAGIIIGLNRATSSEHITASETEATNYCSDYLVTFSSNSAPLLVTASSTGIDFGDDLTVTVTYDYNFLFLSVLGIDPIDIKAKSTMRME